MTTDTDGSALSTLPEDVIPVEQVDKLSTQQFYDYIIGLHIKGYPHEDIAVYCDYNLERINQICNDYDNSDPHTKDKMIASIQTDMIKGTNVTEGRLRNIDNMIIGSVQESIARYNADPEDLMKVKALQTGVSMLKTASEIIKEYKVGLSNDGNVIDAEFEDSNQQVSKGLEDLMSVDTASVVVEEKKDDE